ncbi:hypothetical protein HXT52_04605 [Gardnerella sp. KA00288]|uniref:hypothetical protein n=1 Tax=Gardnerella sp. KA00288 TaxID=2749074 RepID=UPI003BAB7359
MNDCSADLALPVAQFGFETSYATGLSGLVVQLFSCVDIRVVRFEVFALSEGCSRALTELEINGISSSVKA